MFHLDKGKCLYTLNLRNESKLMNTLTIDKRATFEKRLDIALWAQYWMGYIIDEHFYTYVGIYVCMWFGINVFFYS